MIVTLDPQTTRYLETFQALNPSERELVTQTLQQFTSTETVDPAATALAESIAGKTYTRTERIQLEMETLARHFQYRRRAPRYRS